MPDLLTCPRIDDEATRRQFLAGAAAAALLAGCGGADVAAPAAPAAGDGFPVTLTDKFGTITIPAAPATVASVGRTDHDVLLALGIVPTSVATALGLIPSDYTAGLDQTKFFVELSDELVNNADADVVILLTLEDPSATGALDAVDGLVPLLAAKLAA